MEVYNILYHLMVILVHFKYLASTSFPHFSQYAEDFLTWKGIRFSKEVKFFQAPKETVLELETWAKKPFIHSWAWCNQIPRQQA